MSNHMKDWESMNAQSSMTPPARTMQTYRKPKWKEINWKQAELYVNRLQVRIVKAVQADKWRLVKRLQKLITNSFYAKVLAVKRVITNKGKNTPGIDGDIWSTDEDKIQAVYNLTTSSYKAKPLKRTYIEKYGKKEKRPLGIPTMTDRAMQGFTTAGSCPDSRNNSRQGFLWIPAKQMCTRCNGIYVQTPVKKNFSGMDFGR